MRKTATLALKPAVFWCGCGTINSNELLDKVPKSAPNVSLSAKIITMRKLLGTALGIAVIVISVNAQAGVYCDSHDPTIYGTPGNDVITGTMARDVIVGLAGNDVITGAQEIDVICGGPGNDKVKAGQGDDRVFGNQGDDRIEGGYGDDRVAGDEGNDTLMGDWDSDFVYGLSGSDHMCGGGHVPGSRIQPGDQDVCNGGSPRPGEREEYHDCSH
jgi:Ca2+-binding RTX toxin-like protein